ncbi:hypothetical protein M422DRAFT_30709 [Sphaerobolus stellatus SS14]|uniref:MYND-type domain-containing protein n=1 Tax=Sphaerobolus stellatus (strain SS14) TaxID=990650 RepID=A0A0C9VA89_SPHS4|nr:hypothetical protein M422DRAFT_30709 [Sphaerobolus stellatus SS14]
MSQPTVKSLAIGLTIDDDGLHLGDIIPDDVKRQRLDVERNTLEGWSQSARHKLLCEFAARYLPRLFDAWKKNKGALNSHMCMLNYLVSNGIPYFTRFIKQPVAQNMVAIQLERMATSNDYPSGYDAQDLGEIAQFLSSILMYQGADDAAPAHVKVVLPKLKTVMQRYRDGFADETAERCYDYLRGDPISQMMHDTIKKKINEDMNKCGVETCEATVKTHPMKGCAKCRVARYCGPEHQKQAWKKHKTVCFPCDF